MTTDLSKDQHEETNTHHLKFFADIAEGTKVTIPLAAYPDTYMNAFFRTLSFGSSADRNSTYDYIKRVTSDSFIILERRLKDYDKNKMNIEYMLDDMYRLVTKGLINLKKTYLIDQLFEQKITTLTEHINQRIYELMDNVKMRQYIETKKLFPSVLEKYLESRTPTLNIPTVDEKVDTVPVVQLSHVDVTVKADVKKPESKTMDRDEKKPYVPLFPTV